MPKPKVLYILHNHPALHPGGSETYALELYETMRASDAFEPVLVARMGSDDRVRHAVHPGAPFRTLDGDPNQHLVLIEDEVCDHFYTTVSDKALYYKYFADFLTTHKPDIVHFHHTLFIGFDLISLVRRLLPNTPIVYTLHEFKPICQRDGQLLRTRGDELCLEASPRRCHECFPERSEQEFFLRNHFIRTHLSHVDLFLAPSHFLMQRYLDWGMPPEKIRFEDYGRLPARPVLDDGAERPRTRLGFFGQLTPYKGPDVILRAMRMLLDEQPEVHLWLHGANLWKYAEEQQKLFWSLLEETRGNVTYCGDYPHQAVPQLMSNIDWVVVPSRWWENSPLVIQEAFLYGRPVICSGIGGMAEKVSNGVDGLHFSAGDPRSLANVIRKAVTTPGLWNELRAGIPPVYTMEEHIASLSGAYTELLDQRRPAIAPVPG
jgi:glycosyltransferase involved in cell wall biosynthesis